MQIEFESPKLIQANCLFLEVCGIQAHLMYHRTMVGLYKGTLFVGGSKIDIERDYADIEELKAESVKVLSGFFTMCAQYCK